MSLQGVFRGVVVDASSLGSNGRVSVNVPQATTGTLHAPVCYSCNCAWGIEAGAKVMVAFENGNLNYPVVLGKFD